MNQNFEKKIHFKERNVFPGMKEYLLLITILYIKNKIK